LEIYGGATLEHVGLHSTFAPVDAGGQQPEKGQIVEKVYFQSTPTLVVRDRSAAGSDSEKIIEDESDADGSCNGNDFW
jgi:hypothetical protein